MQPACNCGIYALGRAFYIFRRQGYDKTAAELVAVADPDEMCVVLRTRLAESQQLLQHHRDLYPVGRGQGIELQGMLAYRQFPVVGGAGNRAIEHWPTLDVGEWLFGVFAIFNPLWMSGLPGFLFGSLVSLVTGSGESAMNFYMDVAESWGWIVAAPTARAAPWGAKENSALLDALLDEMRMLYNVDENRIYLTGHSMGGFGTWYWGPRKSDVWAACAPCAGGGGPNGVSSKGLPVYIFHGSDDGIVGPSSDRSAAKALLSDKKADFVYTELDKAAERIPDIVSLEVLSEGPFGEGTRWRETRSMFRKEATEEMWVTGFDPPKSYNVDAESHGMHYSTHFSFTPDGDGTRVSWTFSGTAQKLGAKMMAPIFNVLMKSTMKKCMLRDLEALRDQGEENELEVVSLSDVGVDVLRRNRGRTMTCSPFVCPSTRDR